MIFIKQYLKDSIIHDIWHLCRINRAKRYWRKNNRHNDTHARNLFNPSQVTVGNASYGELTVVSFADEHKLHIGNYVSIAQCVTFLLDADHYTDHISTYPYKVKCLRAAIPEAFGKGDIIVEDDVWIGYGATILSGVHIGQGAVVAAAAVVTKDVPPYAVVGGVPAKILKYRFSKELISELTKVDYERLTQQEIEKHIDELYLRLTSPEQLDWLPRKTQ